MQEVQELDNLDSGADLEASGCNNQNLNDSNDSNDSSLLLRHTNGPSSPSSSLGMLSSHT